MTCLGDIPELDNDCWFSSAGFRPPQVSEEILRIVIGVCRALFALEKDDNLPFVETKNYLAVIIKVKIIFSLVRSPTPVVHSLFKHLTLHGSSHWQKK